MAAIDDGDRRILIRFAANDCCHRAAICWSKSHRVDWTSDAEGFLHVPEFDQVNSDMKEVILLLDEVQD